MQHFHITKLTDVLKKELEATWKWVYREQPTTIIVWNIGYETTLNTRTIVFYNLSGYDFSLFIKDLWKKFNKDGIEVIGENNEKYISFSFKINVKLAEVTNKDSKELL